MIAAIHCSSPKFQWSEPNLVTVAWHIPWMELQQIGERAVACNLEICEHSQGFCTEQPLFSAEEWPKRKKMSTLKYFIKLWRWYFYLYCFPKIPGIILVFERICSHQHNIESHSTWPYICHLNESKKDIIVSTMN